MKPIVGEWYRREGVGEFQVSDFDEEDDMIEITFSDGTIEDWELGDWNEAVSCNELTLFEPLEEDEDEEEEDLDFDDDEDEEDDWDDEEDEDE